MKKLQLLSLDEITVLVKDCQSSAELCRKLGYNSSSSTTRMRVFLLSLNVDISHWSGQLWSKGKTALEDNRLRPNKSIMDIFSERSNASVGYVRKLIFEKNLLPYKCLFCCVGDTWQDKKIVLQLDHINGNRLDHRMENLRWLCPNCHSQTPTFCGRNMKKKPHVTDDVLITALKNSKNIWNALQKVGLANGRNFQRAKKLLKSKRSPTSTSSTTGP